jgi:hypothetical protein
MMLITEGNQNQSPSSCIPMTLFRATNFWVVRLPPRANAVPVRLLAPPGETGAASRPALLQPPPITPSSCPINHAPFPAPNPAPCPEPRSLPAAATPPRPRRFRRRQMGPLPRNRPHVRSRSDLPCDAVTNTTASCLRCRRRRHRLPLAPPCPRAVVSGVHAAEAERRPCSRGVVASLRHDVPVEEAARRSATCPTRRCPFSSFSFL